MTAQRIEKRLTLIEFLSEIVIIYYSNNEIPLQLIKDYPEYHKHLINLSNFIEYEKFFKGRE